MKEIDVRDSKHSTLLWLLVPLLVLSGLLHFLPVANVYDWVFVYYMSYDNDLSPYGKAILNDLRNGVVNSKIAVTVQADLDDNRGMKRIALCRSNGKTQKKEIPLRSEDSADDVELRKYLDWVRRKWNAKNYCIVFLNHGGTLNNMCQDRKPFRDLARNKIFGSGKWLHASQVATDLQSFNRKVGSKVRLLFLQQCGRAAIQNLYSFVDCAEYIMASPLRVDAPNTYYKATLASVALDPNITGETLAESIMREDEHYTVYTLIDNNQLRRLPEKLIPVLNSFKTASVLNQPKSLSPIFEFGSEKFYDLKSYLQSASAANSNIADQELGDFFSWCENRLIVSKSFRRPDSNNPSCGISIYVPSSSDPNTCYDALPLYRQSTLNAVIRLMTK